MPSYNIFTIKPTQKKLYLRISKELDHIVDYRKAVEEVANIFAPYFSEVEVVFASEQSKIVNKLRSIHPVVSLDKEIKGNYNLDISRVYSVTYGEYVKHFESQDNAANIPHGLEVILYDHDVVKGYQINKVKNDLERNGCKVHVFTFIKADKNTEEVLDLRDFLLDSESYYPNDVSAGLLVNKYNAQGTSQHYRVSYLHSCVLFKERTSIPNEKKKEVKDKIDSFKNAYGISND